MGKPTIRGRGRNRSWQVAKEALWEKQREVEREIPCYVTKVPGVCKKPPMSQLFLTQTWLYTHRDTWQQPDTCGDQGPGPAGITLTAGPELRGKRGALQEVSPMLALVWFPGSPHGLKSVAAPGRAQPCLPLGSPSSCQGLLPQSRFLFRLVLRPAGSWQQTSPGGSLGSLAQAITGPFQTTAD